MSPTRAACLAGVPPRLNMLGNDSATWLRTVGAAD
jgi:hypothetical protein